MGDSHKQHEFIGLPEAAELQKDYFGRKLVEVEKVIGLIEGKLGDVGEWEAKISGKAEQRLKDVRR